MASSKHSHLDPRTSQSEIEVQKIEQLQRIAYQLPEAFTDAAKVTKSHIIARNVPARIDVPAGQTVNIATNESSKARQKRGRPYGF